MDIATGPAPLAPSPPSALQPSPGNDEKPKPISMRGRKKHKCTVCGNSARSRCPYNSCKSCCAKAKNPCFIHVFKTNQTPRQQSSPATGKGDLEEHTGISSLTSPMGSLRHLSGLHQGVTSLSPAQQAFDSVRLRTIKSPLHLTRKEAVFTNAWRFHKLKGYIESKTAAEDEAFDRYMQNVSLLEEVFALNAEPLEGISPDGQLIIHPGNEIDDADLGVDAAKLSLALRIRSRISTKRKEAHRQKIRRVIDRSMQRLHRGEREDASIENEDAYAGFLGVRREIKKIKVQSKEGKDRLKRMDLFNALFEKLKHVENQADVNTCLEMYEDNFVEVESGIPGASEDSASLVSSQNKALAAALRKDYFKLDVAVGGQKANTSTPVKTGRKTNLDTHGISRSWWKVDINNREIDSCKEWMTADLNLAAL